MGGEQQELFGSSAQAIPAAARLPEGFVYRPEIITCDEEASLLAVIRALPLTESRYKEYTAKRRTVSFGGQYDFGANRLESAPPIPESLMPLRETVARWTGIDPGQFVHALVSEYQPGSPLGWHRDVPDFEVIVGVSLGGRARMRLRPYRPGEKQRREDVIAIELAPRSAYVMRGHARWGWQHSIAATKELRYSITFRTARERA